MAGITGIPEIKANANELSSLRTETFGIGGFVHTDAVYAALMGTIITFEQRLGASLENYQEHPDVQANLQQLQYDLQQWNLALTTMTNINKNLGDALNSIASNFR